MAGVRPDLAVMESTGVYWKSPDAALEQVGIPALVVRRGHKRAIFALAHKLLKLVLLLIDRGDYYRDATVDYEALSVARNAPRWIEMLRKHGYPAI